MQKPTGPESDGLSARRNVSTCPNGEEFPLPQASDYQAEYERLEAAVREERRKGREIVVVVGVGFVGAVMAAVVADSADTQDRQARQVRDRHAAAQHAQLLEDPAAQPGRLAGQGRGPGGRRR